MSDEATTPDADKPVKKKRRNNSSASNVVHNFATSGILKVIQIVTAFCVTRQIGASDKGVYAFLLLFSAFLLPLLSFGVNSGSRYLISSKSFTIRDTVFSCLSFGLIQGLFTAAITMTLWSFDMLGETGKDLSLLIVLPVAAAIPMRGIVLAAEQALIADSQFKFVNKATLFDSAVNAVLLWTLVIFLDMGLQGVVIAILANCDFAHVHSVGVLLDKLPSQVAHQLWISRRVASVWTQVVARLLLEANQHEIGPCLPRISRSGSNLGRL